jgi:hypothetical protein
MYSDSKVAERIEIARQELEFRPEYHTPSEIDEFERRLGAKYAAEYAAARAAAQGAEDPVKAFQISLMRDLANPDNPRLSPDEVRWMKNERALVMCDAAYFLTRYYWISNRENLTQRFTFQAGQKILFDCIAEMEERGLPIEIILAKARQLGMTTLVEGMMLLKIMFDYGVNGVVASADRSKTREMVKKIFFAYDKLAWWFRPLTSKRVESDQGQIIFNATDSGLSFQHGKQTNPIAMGSTPVCYHLSEVSSYPDAEDLIEVGLFKCVHPSPRVLGILESTCKGDEGWWYETYWNAKSQWGRGRSRLMALFLPFFCGTDMYPNPVWLRGHPIPTDWRPEPETRMIISESEIYVTSSPVLSKVLGKGHPWKMPREQAWYWECNYIEHRDKGMENTWWSEMPHTDQAAFVGSYDNVFGKPVIAEAWSKRETVYNVYAVVGQSIEERHEPDPEEVDYEVARVPVEYRSRRGDVYRWELVPMLWKERFRSLEDRALRNDDSHMGKFFVWLPPEPGYDYALGIDTSNGIGSDNTVIAVSRRARNSQEQDIQAAEFRSNVVSHVEAYAWAMAIAAYYARFMGEGSGGFGPGVPHREPYVSVEQIAAVGDTCQLQMSKMGYSRFHQMIRYDSRPKDMKKSKSRKRGWYTTTWSRPMLTDGFVILVQNEWYKVNSPYTLNEMQHWEIHLTAGGKEKFEHGGESTDDGIFANAMAAFCPNDLKPMAERTAKRFMGPAAQSEGPALDLTPTNVGFSVPVSGYSTYRVGGRRR